MHLITWMAFHPLPQMQESVEKARDELKRMQQAKQSADTAARLRNEVNSLQTEIQRLEDELASTGSTRTVGDVEDEIRALSDQM